MILKKIIPILLACCISVACAPDFNTADPSLIALFPQQNDLRNTLNRSGIWKFRKDSPGVGAEVYLCPDLAIFCKK